MCGIAGSYQLQEGAASDDRVAQALRAIAHRGPDDEGVYRSGRTILGHRRLSVIDTSAAGHQPFTDEGGRYTIVFNGEVFNFKELRAELEANGHRFRSHTDTEVVLRLFTIKGEAFLHDLNGFFALAIHDAQEDTLFLARDRFGVKPLLWSDVNGRFLFASELRALMALGCPCDVDQVSLRQYFTFHYIPAPHTILHHAQKLLPGHCARVSSAGVTIRRWYDLPEAAGNTERPVEPQSHLFQLLDDAVQSRLVADVPVGTFLSGGLDSSIVSALASRHHPALHTFSIGFAEDDWFDESRFAEAVAVHIGSEHHAFRLTRQELADAYAGLLHATDEPFADSSALASYILCRHTRDHVTVALSGDGADEVFGGYSKHQAEWRFRHAAALEQLVIGLGPLWGALPRSRGGRVTDLFRRLDRFAATAKGTAEERWLALASFDTDDDRSRLLGHAPEAPGLAVRHQRMTAGLGRMPGLNGVLLADVLETLPNDMLHKVDMTSMAHALEVRTPFLDRRVVEFAFALPAEQRFKLGSGKHLLRRTFGHLLPHQTLTRAKRGFEVPLRALLTGPLQPLVDELFTEELVTSAGLSHHGVQAVRARMHGANPGQAQATAHALIVYLSWWRRWIS
ncbi:MAG: asparagine synthase (glutamine-hydrolyzing) [Flavobacteriales bacterium]|nr:asparagine synthase (glutamine-hydrolyzing) [Flavobacteriales bacterium]